MLRRAALDSVGGIAEETITEDLHTSIRMHSADWKSVFHPGVVALGIAPNDYDSFIMQRLRWAQGAMQVLNREWRIPGLSLAQRLNYAGSTGTYFDSLRKAVFLSIIPAVILTDQLPVAASAQVFLLFWATQYLLGAATNSLLGRGSYRFLPTEFFDFLKMFAFIRATPILLSGKPLQFRVTPKGRSSDRRIHPLLMPHLALVGVYLGCGVVAFSRVLEIGPLTTGNETAMIASGLWALAVLVMLSWVVVYGYRHISQRRADRVPVSMNGSWGPKQGKRDRLATFRNLTLLGCSILIAEQLERGTEIRLSISTERLTLTGTVVNLSKSPEGYVAGVRFELSEATATRLAGVIAKGILATYAGVQPEDYARPVVEAAAA
jgi:cellulose synthase (UDP-forming)